MSKINSIEIKNTFNLVRNENNIEDLYNKYSNIVYGIAFSIIKNKEEADDITQRVFIKIYEMDKSKLPLSGEASWLYTLTKNETIDTLRKIKHSLDIENYEVEDSNDYISKIIDIEYYNNLISGLNKTEKEIISLKVLSNLSFDEIAKLLNMPSGTVKWKYYKSVDSLKITLSSLAISIIAFIIGLKPLLKKDPTISDFTEESLPPISIDISTTPSHTVDYSKLISWGICGIFFAVSLIFLIIFIKNQLKARKKRLNSRTKKWRY